MAGVLIEELPLAEFGDIVVQGRSIHPHNRRAKSQRCQPVHQAQCGTQQRSGSHDPRSRGPRGRSRDLRRAAGLCAAKAETGSNLQPAEDISADLVLDEATNGCVAGERAVAEDVVLNSDAEKFKWRASVGTWCGIRPSQQFLPSQEKTESLIENLRAQACDLFVEAFRSGSLQRALEEIMDADTDVSDDVPSTTRCSEHVEHEVDFEFEDAESEENEDVTASAFICSLLDEVVDDYSDEAIYEIRHQHEAARVFEVPWPTIEEEDECSLMDEEEAELIEEEEEVQVASTVYSSTAELITKDAVEKAADHFMNAAFHGLSLDRESTWSDSDGDCEEVLSVGSSGESCADDLEEEEAAQDLAAKIVWTQPADGGALRDVVGDTDMKEIAEDKEDDALDALEFIRLKMRSILEAACDNGSLETTITNVQNKDTEVGSLESIRLKMRDILQAAAEDGRLDTVLTDMDVEDPPELPAASSLSPCTRPSFTRQFHPRLTAAPVPEEPFPCDCLPPSTAVARSMTPAGEAWLCLMTQHAEASLTPIPPIAPEANERMCRALAVAALQALYSKHDLPAAPLQAAHEVSASSRTADVGFKARAEARDVLAQAVMDGRLEAAIEEIKREREEQERLEQLEKVRCKMQATLVKAAEDGRLKKAYEDLKFEQMCEQVRSGLIAALESGALEAAIRDEHEAARKPAAALVPSRPVGSSTSACSPARRRIAGGRTVTATEAQSELPISLVPAPPPRPQTTSANPRRCSARSVSPSVPSASRPTRPGSRPTGMLSAPSPEGLAHAAVHAPVQPPCAPSGARRPARPNTLSISAHQTVEEVTHSFRIDSSPDNSPQAGRSSSIAESYRTLGTAQFFYIDGPDVDKELRRLPQAPKAPSTPRKHASSFVVASETVSKASASTSRHRMLLPVPPSAGASKMHEEDLSQRSSFAARGEGPTALELDLGVSVGTGALHASTTPADAFATSSASPRLFKNAIGTGLLPVISSMQSTIDVSSWSIGVDHRPSTPRSARNNPSSLF
mmetsp:Transcript_23882/g.37434  ORF Transcript_23882/g.37434 Transcript_23882/m.37434 type:complete len:1024 (-) Transcript_23882:249-3320(-)